MNCHNEMENKSFGFFNCCYSTGHGSDVKCIDWHPHKALIVSGSKDSQQPIILWDPKSGKKLATLLVTDFFRKNRTNE